MGQQPYQPQEQLDDNTISRLGNGNDGNGLVNLIGVDWSQLDNTFSRYWDDDEESSGQDIREHNIEKL